MKFKKKIIKKNENVMKIVHDNINLKNKQILLKKTKRQSKSEKKAA